MPAWPYYRAARLFEPRKPGALPKEIKNMKRLDISSNIVISNLKTSLMYTVIQKVTRAVNGYIDGEISDLGLFIYKETKYDLLHSLMKQVLSAPASSASTEQVFSQAG